MSNTTNQSYQVLARKYRPETFADLVGQDAMVRTLKNAFAADRIAQAFIMTGIRGTGKTTTARIIAKGMNCIGPDRKGGPTTDPCGVCEHCSAIIEGRHIDVMEMDAASRTGVDDIREIYEAGWRLGLKAVALYRDGSKASQPLSTSQSDISARGLTTAEQEGSSSREKRAYISHASVDAHLEEMMGERGVDVDHP